MAVNHADGTLFTSVVFCPIAAAKAAASVGAGWFSILFIPVGLALGIAVAWMGRKFIYSMMDLFLRRKPEAYGRWFQWIVGGPVLLLYLILPYAIVCAGVLGTWFGSIWLVRLSL